jgi:hypothetical protein
MRFSAPTQLAPVFGTHRIRIGEEESSCGRQPAGWSPDQSTRSKNSSPRRGQNGLPVRDRDHAELRIEVTAVLQVDQQPTARADIGAPVGQRVLDLELLAEPVDELPQLLQRNIVLAPVGPQQADFDEFRPRDVAGTRGLYPDHGTIARRAALSHQCSVDGATRSSRAAAASVCPSPGQGW